MHKCWKCGRAGATEREAEWIGGRGYVTLWACLDYLACAARREAQDAA